MTRSIRTLAVGRRSAPTLNGLLVAALTLILALALSPGAQATSQRSAASASTAAAATTEVVAIRAKINNKYVVAENAGNFVVDRQRVCSRPVGEVRSDPYH